MSSKLEFPRNHAGLDPDQRGESSPFVSSEQPRALRGQPVSFPDAFSCTMVSTVPELMAVMQSGILMRVDAVIAGEVVGTAHVPLAPLLNETWVQGVAKLWAPGAAAFASQPYQQLIPTLCWPGCTPACL